MKLTDTSVFLDFDGTITEADTGVHLLEQLAPPAWREIDALYEAGSIGSRECTARQWAMLPADRARIETTAGEVPIDRGFGPLVGFLRSAGAEVTIVSDGFGVRVHETGLRMGIPVVANAIDWTHHAVVFPHADVSCECGVCGVCKRAPICEAKARGRSTVLVGDGTSDAKAAPLADVLFAKGWLADWCTRSGVPLRRFESLTDVLEQLRALPW